MRQQIGRNAHQPLVFKYVYNLRIPGDKGEGNNVVRLKLQAQTGFTEYRMTFISEIKVNSFNISSERTD